MPASVTWPKPLAERVAPFPAPRLTKAGRPFAPKDGAPGSRVSWCQQVDGKPLDFGHLDRAGVVWSLAPNSCVWVIPDEPLPGELVALVTAPDKRSGQRRGQSTQRDWHRLPVLRADAIRAAGALVQTHRERPERVDWAGGRWLAKPETRIVREEIRTHLSGCAAIDEEVAAGRRISGGGEFYALNAYVRAAVDPSHPHVRREEVGEWCERCLGLAALSTGQHETERAA